VIVLLSKTRGLYDRDEYLLKKTTLDELPAILQVATVNVLVIFLAESVVVAGHLGKVQVVLLWVLLLFLTAAGRLIARRVARSLTPPERCLVVGDDLTCTWTAAKLRADPAINAAVVDCLSPVPETVEDEPADRVTAVADHVTARGVDRVIIAPEGLDPDTVLDTVRVVKSLGVRLSLLPRLFEVVGSSVEFDGLDGTTLLGLRRYGLPRSSRRLKRATDLAGASVALLLAAPVWIAAVVAVRATSPGPALFRQRRIGYDGRRFWMLKFRTMVDGADEQKPALEVLNEADGLFKIADDPRSTPVGRFLRRSSLDELPQLVNVLRGEMSLVGPRPLVPEDDRRIEGWERKRLQLYPGMTGMWQVFGSARIPLDEMVKIDYLYAANWSLWLDCKILLQTVPHVLRRRGL
jgi:exopolysaccharide biosynthesis polyprenyl glycosylphosphotransferase